MDFRTELSRLKGPESPERRKVQPSIFDQELARYTIFNNLVTVGTDTFPELRPTGNSPGSRLHLQETRRRSKEHICIFS